MRGFFTASKLTSKQPIPSLAAKCGMCGLYKHCHSPKMATYGEGRKGILLVGEAPGKEEDEQNRSFVGESGRLLKKQLQQVDVSIDRDCWRTNAVICRPEKNRTPTDKEVGYCRPNLLKTIDQLKPITIVLLGGTAVRSLIGYLWKESTDSIGRWVGWRIPSQSLNAWVCPTFHPAYVLRTRDKRGQSMPGKMLYDHLKAAASLTSRPWEEVPDYRSEVSVVYDAKDAAKQVRGMLKRSRPIAFDYETNMLKPDSSNAEVVSCSVSQATGRTIAFPWHGEAIDAMAELLGSRIPKIASNIKFEHRWTLRALGLHVQGWAWDTMLAAHVLDNRPGITGLKFQSFVLLGFGSYDDEIANFLYADNANKENRIRKAPLDELLLYNGLDSLLEVKVAEIQSSQLGVPLWNG